jgi:hypothetical protein
MKREVGSTVGFANQQIIGVHASVLHTTSPFSLALVRSGGMYISPAKNIEITLKISHWK